MENKKTEDYFDYSCQNHKKKVEESGMKNYLLLFITERITLHERFEKSNATGGS